jgi:hypothetical protein
MKPTPLPKETVIAPVLKLEEQLAAARKTATETLLEERRQIDASLEKIGYSIEGASGRRLPAKERVCKVCGQIGHNARKHKDSASTPPSS